MIIVFVAALGQLSQPSRRNTATVLIAVVKSDHRLKGTKLFTCGCLEKISNIFQNLQGRAGSFYCKVAACNGL